MQSSTTDWADFEEIIAKTLNIFTLNLCAQYVLSNKPTNTIPIALASEDDLTKLHRCLTPLVIPSQNANGLKSKQKMKELTVKVTDKSNDTTLKPSSVSGKVCDRYILQSSQVLKESFYRRRIKVKI